MALLAHGGGGQSVGGAPAQDWPAEPQLLGTQGSREALGAAGSGRTRSSAAEAAQAARLGLACSTPLSLIPLSSS